MIGGKSRKWKSSYFWLHSKSDEVMKISQKPVSKVFFCKIVPTWHSRINIARALIFLIDKPRTWSRHRFFVNVDSWIWLWRSLSSVSTSKASRPLILPVSKNIPSISSGPNVKKFASTQFSDVDGWNLKIRSYEFLWKKISKYLRTYFIPPPSSYCLKLIRLWQ